MVQYRRRSKGIHTKGEKMKGMKKKICDNCERIVPWTVILVKEDMKTCVKCGREVVARKNDWKMSGKMALLMKPVNFNSRDKIASVRGFLNKKTGEIKLFSEEAFKREGSKKIIEKLNEL